MIADLYEKMYAVHLDSVQYRGIAQTLQNSIHVWRQYCGVKFAKQGKSSLLWAWIPRWSDTIGASAQRVRFRVWTT